MVPIHAVPACLKVHNVAAVFSKLCSVICAEASLVSSVNLQVNAFVVENFVHADASATPTQQLPASLTRSLARSLTHFPTHPLTHSLTHPPIFQ